MKHIMRCPRCREYTMKDVCRRCDVKTENPKPAKFSVEDPYGKYRRKAKEMEGTV